jgi:hypothetical protein
MGTRQLQGTPAKLTKLQVCRAQRGEIQALRLLDPSVIVTGNERATQSRRTGARRFWLSALVAGKSMSRLVRGFASISPLLLVFGARAEPVGSWEPSYAPP